MESPGRGDTRPRCGTHSRGYARKVKGAHTGEIVLHPSIRHRSPCLRTRNVRHSEFAGSALAESESARKWPEGDAGARGQVFASVGPPGQMYGRKALPPGHLYVPTMEGLPVAWPFRHAMRAAPCFAVFLEESRGSGGA